MKQQLEEARACINWEEQFFSPTALERFEVEWYQRLGVLDPTPPISSCPIELKEEDASSSINDSSALSVASTSVSTGKIDRC